MAASQTFYADADSDGFGDPNDSQQAISAPAGYVLDNTDNCPDVANADQAGADNDSIGDACDTILVSIDIKPGSDPNSLNLNGNGVVPMAVFGSAGFNVGDIDVSTVRCGVDGDEAVAAHGGHIEDLDGDGYDDIVFHFREGDLGIDTAEAGDTILALLLTGQLNDTTEFEGADVVRITPNNDRSRGKGGKDPK